MRILFIQNKSPKTFRHIAQEFTLDPNNKVIYLSTQCPREYKIPKVRHICIHKVLTPPRTSKDDAALLEAQYAIQNASMIANALLRLKRNGFIPDIIYTTPQDGSLYIKDIFPESFLIIHATWFYTMNESYNFFHKGKTRSPIQFAPARIRNLFQFNALNDCNLSITSTKWQKEQYPEGIREKIIVSPEGIDTDLFSPGKTNLFKDLEIILEPDNSLVTFFSKNAEPYRGFPQFINAIPSLLKLNPKCHILICGIEKKHLEQQLMSLNEKNKDAQIDLNRIHVFYKLTLHAYIQILRASTVHVYLTAPYALSSSLLEAMSCGCLVVGSDTAPVREIISHGQNGFLNDFWDSEALAQTISGILNREDLLESIRENARNTILHNYDKQLLTKNHMELVLKMFNLNHSK